MTFATFVILLAICSTVTSICTQCVKKIFDEKKIAYTSNVLVFIMGCIVGIGGTAVYYILNSVQFDIANTTCMVLMGLATSSGAIIGYDAVSEVIQMAKQFKSHK